MVEHELKIDPDLWPAIRDRKKTAEVRLNDRNYIVGDTLVIYPFDRSTGQRIGDDCAMRVITHIVLGGHYGIESGYCLLSMS